MNTTEEKKENEITGLSPDQFYKSIDILHKKVKKLNKIILDYFQNKNGTYLKDFFAVQFINYKVHDITDSVKNKVEDTESFKEVLEIWFANKETSEYVDDIFKIEMEDKIFLFQYFKFHSTEDGVIAGYLLENTIESRILLFNISNSHISDTSNSIMEYFKR